jgi:hypothetical protein
MLQAQFSLIKPCKVLVESIHKNLEGHVTAVFAENRIAFIIRILVHFVKTMILCNRLT